MSPELEKADEPNEVAEAIKHALAAVTFRNAAAIAPDDLIWTLLYASIAATYHRVSAAALELFVATQGS